MATEASLPVNDEIEEPEAPVDEAVDAPEAPEPIVDDTLDAIEEPAVEEIVAEAAESPEPPEDQPEPVADDDASAEAVHAEPAGDGTTEAMAAWTEALHSVERSVNDAAEAIRFLRATVAQMAPLWRSLGGLEDAMRGFEQPPQRRLEPETIIGPRPAPLRYEEDEEPEPDRSPSLRHDEPAQPEREWPIQRRKPSAREKAPTWEEPEREWVPPDGVPRPSLKPVTLVPDDTPAPYAYKVTIEDRKSPIELVLLHRALTSIPSVRNLSLLNYVNGVASLSLETTDEIQPPELENAIKKVMKRSCSVVPHESNVILIQVGE